MHEEVTVYGSGGSTTYDDARTVAQLSHWVHEQRIPRVKIKVGESSGRDPDHDAHRIRLAAALSETRPNCSSMPTAATPPNKPRGECARSPMPVWSG